jgi:MipA family protein
MMLHPTQELEPPANPERFTDTDSAELTGIDRDHTLDGGVQLDFDLSEATGLVAKAVMEVTDEHDGQEVMLALQHRLFLGQVPLMVDAGLKWQSEELSNYLYGVRDSEATGTRAAYSPGEVAISYPSVGTAVPISDKARIIGAVRADFLSDEVSDSPVIDKDVDATMTLGLAFSF